CAGCRRSGRASWRGLPRRSARFLMRFPMARRPRHNPFRVQPMTSTLQTTSTLPRSDLAGHRLAKLLMPRSVALVGASPKKGSVGHGMLRGLLGGGFEGVVYPVNPNYQEIDGVRCYPSLAALPEAPEHVLLGVANQRLEAALEDAVAA